MHKFTKTLLGGVAAIALALGGVASYAAYVAPLGFSIFPYTPVTQPVVNLTDTVNELLALINSQVMPSNVVITPPGGRLSLTSVVGGVPAGDVALESSVFYMPYDTQLMPVYNGTSWQYVDFGPSGLQLTLGSADAAQTIGGVPALYDVYGFVNNGSPTICHMAWGGTTRSTTAGGGTNGSSGTQNASIAQLNGIWTNNAAIATGNCFGGTGSAASNAPTAYVIGKNQATLLGTVNLPSTGGISQLCRGVSGGALASAAGGLQSAGVNLSNVYNRVPLNCSNLDNAQTTTTSTTFVAMGNNDLISWVDSIGNTSASYQATIQQATIVSGATARVDSGVGYSSNAVMASTGLPNIIGTSAGLAPALASNWQTVGLSEAINPQAGLNTLWMEKRIPGGGTGTYGLVSNGIGLTLSIMY